MEEQDYILFDQYLLDQLSTEERSIFDKRLKTDTAFEKSFNTYKALSNFLENKFENEAETNAFKSNLENISKKHFSQSETIIKTKKKTTVFRIGQLAIAASIAIFLGVFAFNQFSSPTYSDYNNHEAISLTVRGTENTLLVEAESAFNNKEYEKAEVLFNTILKDDPLNLEIELYKSITLIETSQFNEADAILLGLSEGDSGYKNKAKWYWALSKLKQKEFDECIKILKTIPQDAEDYKQAQKLLNKLD